MTITPIIVDFSHKAGKLRQKNTHKIEPYWTWLCLAEFFLRDVDWDKTKRNCFNDRRNPDDDELDTQIVKDLHRTGCGWFFESDTAEERASLKRVLLAYARWNKAVGYCQGFNVIAALILQVMEGNEEEALKVMIYLVDYILPRNYFANNLRALSVDMAVLRELMAIKLCELAKHLDRLQKESMKIQLQAPGNTSYEPPLVNVFTMQWFLTLFATCLPRDTVLQIWDAVLLEGSECLLRVALAIWAKLGDYLDNVETAADFYMTMGTLLQKMMDEEFIDASKMIQFKMEIDQRHSEGQNTITKIEDRLAQLKSYSRYKLRTVYTMAPFPFPQVMELREKYTYDIHPFSTFSNDKSPDKRNKKLVQPSDDEEEDNEIDPVAVGCLAIFPFPGMDASPSKEISEAEYSPSKTDIGAATPGAVNTDPETQRAFRMQRALAEKRREKENLDLSQLQKQYMRMRRLQQKNMLVFNSILPQSKERRNPNPPSAINHLFIDIPKVETRTKGSTHKVRRHDNSDLVTEPKDDHSENTTPKPAEATNGKAAHFDGRSSELSNHAKPYLKKDISTSPLISVSLHALGKSSEPSDQHLLNNKAKVAKNGRNFGNVSSKPSSKSTHIVKSQNFTQPALFAIDRNALYPANFKPFPQRTHQPKSKLLAGAISQSTSTPATSNQSQHKLPSRLWPMLEL